jgi:thiamine pyrophosphate-dependent acetolactate synthase large subunit-like protein
VRCVRIALKTADRILPAPPKRLSAKAAELPRGLGVEVRTKARAIARAERPVIIAGNGVRVAQAYEALERLAETLGAPVVTTAAGKGVFAETHPLALGVFGTSHGVLAVKRA